MVKNILFLPKHDTYFCVCLTDGAARIFSPSIPLFILSLKKSSYGQGILISQREYTHDHFAMAGIRTHDLSLLSRALYPLGHRALHQVKNLEVVD